MHAFVGYLVSGLANGSVYGLLAMAAILVFKASRTANFAIGETGTFSAFALYAAVVTVTRLPYWVGLLVALVAGAAVALATEAIITRNVRSALLVLIGTLGISDVITGINTVLWSKGEPYQEPSFPQLPDVSLGGVGISGQYLSIFAAVVVICLLLYFLLEHTGFGLNVRAAAEDRDLAALAGVNVRRCVMVMWAAGGALAAVAAVLVAPLSALNVGLMTPLLFNGYAAGILGGLDRLPGGLVGGLGLGVASSLIGGYISSTAEDAILFAVLIVLLSVRPNGLLGRRVVQKV
ncbi:MAG TPA: branched-chain amino acid ABC transporter permease [Pseudonocardiaceae bacterium]|jgi:branched-chain amino acid transport system permease protein